MHNVGAKIFDGSTWDLREGDSFVHQSLGIDGRLAWLGLAVSCHQCHPFLLVRA